MLLGLVDPARFSPRPLIDLCFRARAPDLAERVLELNAGPYSYDLREGQRLYYPAVWLLANGHDDLVNIQKLAEDEAEPAKIARELVLVCALDDEPPGFRYTGPVDAAPRPDCAVRVQRWEGLSRAELERAARALRGCACGLREALRLLLGR